jgi:protein-disulfide isomerase
MSEGKALKSGLLEKFVPILLVVSVALAFAVGVLWQKVSNLESGKSKVAGTEATASGQAKAKVSIETIKDLFDKDVIKLGDAKRKLLIVEVSDPSCPYCSIASGKNAALNKQAGEQFKLVADGGTYVAPVPEFKKLVDDGKASFIYLYTSGHGNGEMGAKALYCAFDEGKFWEVHDLLMGAQGYALLNETVKNDKAKSGELAEFLKSATDATKMKACLDSGKYDSRINSDIQLASSLGITGTPGFFLNETPFYGAYGYKDMQSAVDAALK